MSGAKDPITGREIREAGLADVEAVLALWQEAAEEPTATDDAGGVHVLLERDSQSLLLAVEAGMVVGSIIAGWDGWRGNLYRLAVLPGHRRQGIAMELVRAAEGRLARLGARRVHAGVLGAYPSAVAFWEAAGYTADARISRHRKDLSRG